MRKLGYVSILFRVPQCCGFPGSVLLVLEVPIFWFLLTENRKGTQEPLFGGTLLTRTPRPLACQLIRWPSQPQLGAWDLGTMRGPQIRTRTGSWGSLDSWSQRSRFGTCNPPSPKRSKVCSEVLGTLWLTRDQTWCPLVSLLMQKSQCSKFPSRFILSRSPNIWHPFTVFLFFRRAWAEGSYPTLGLPNSTPWEWSRWRCKASPRALGKARADSAPRADGLVQDPPRKPQANPPDLTFGVCPFWFPFLAKVPKG